jgi:RHS repeat-associated protein
MATITYTYDPENRLTQVQKPNPPAPDNLAQAVDSELAFTTGGLGLWWRQTGSPSYYDGDCAQSGGISDGDESWMQTAVAGAGTVTFWWKVSSESYCDYLEFYLDGQLQSNPISGEVAWTQKSYTITGAGPHTLRWRYVKDGSSSFGDDCGWVDWVQWSGPLPEPAADAWGTLNYLYDAGGRRIEKRCDGRTITKYVYDGDHCIAEYDAGGTLRRKYLYGPGVDEPICMIEATASYAGTYYYHLDGLGSVVALTNSSGNTVEVYEYDVYGRVGASDPNHPNRFMFTGREFDKETGLYYYRARYYNPQIGRFLQTDPAGYGDGMNWYAYCRNCPVGRVDPSGRESNTDPDRCDKCGLPWDAHSGDVALNIAPYTDTTIESYNNGLDFSEYYEWTGAWKITGQRTTAADITFRGFVKAIVGGAEIVDSLASGVKTVKAMMEGVIWADACGEVLAGWYNWVSGQMAAKAIEDFKGIEDSWGMEPPYRAFIEVRVYVRRYGLRAKFFGKWGGRGKRWVEVCCGYDYNPLGSQDGDGGYGAFESAMSAIHEAVNNLRVRPD